MDRVIKALLVATGIVGACWQPLIALQKPQEPAAAKSQRISVCSLLPKEEVKKHIPWLPMLDRLPIEEEPIGISGSSCNYPSVHIQVFSFSQSTIDSARKKGGLETITGVGDEAYFHNNANRYAELYVRVGKHLLTLQAGVRTGANIESAKPGVLNLAKALVEKLR